MNKKTILKLSTIFLLAITSGFKISSAMEDDLDSFSITDELDNYEDDVDYKDLADQVEDENLQENKEINNITKDDIEKNYKNSSQNFLKVIEDEKKAFFKSAAKLKEIVSKLKENNQINEKNMNTINEPKEEDPIKKVLQKLFREIKGNIKKELEKIKKNLEDIETVILDKNKENMDKQENKLIKLLINELTKKQIELLNKNMKDIDYHFSESKFEDLLNFEDSDYGNKNRIEEKIYKLGDYITGCLGNIHALYKDLYSNYGKMYLEKQAEIYRKNMASFKKDYKEFKNLLSKVFGSDENDNNENSNGRNNSEENNSGEIEIKKEKRLEYIEELLNVHKKYLSEIKICFTIYEMGMQTTIFNDARSQRYKWFK